MWILLSCGIQNGADEITIMVKKLVPIFKSNSVVGRHVHLLREQFKKFHGPFNSTHLLSQNFFRVWVHFMRDMSLQIKGSSHTDVSKVHWSGFELWPVFAQSSSSRLKQLAISSCWQGITEHGRHVLHWLNCCPSLLLELPGQLASV